MYRSNLGMTPDFLAACPDYSPQLHHVVTAGPSESLAQARSPFSSAGPSGRYSQKTFGHQNGYFNGVSSLVTSLECPKTSGHETLTY